MKYLRITKRIWNSGSHSWHLTINEGYKNKYKSRKSNMLAEKLEKVFNGECNTVTHNKVEYEMNKSQFKCNDYPVYLVYRVNESVPCFLWYKGLKHFETDYSMIIDEDIELFDKYGYNIVDIRMN